MGVQPKPMENRVPAILKLLAIPGALAVMLGLAEIGNAPAIPQQIFGLLSVGFGFLIILLALGLGTIASRLDDIRNEAVAQTNQLRTNAANTQ